MTSCRIPLVRAAVLFALACAISGCATTYETQDADATVFRWHLWVPLLAIAGGIVCVFLGLLLRHWSARLSMTLVFLGPLACIVLAPGLFKDKVTVNQEGFTLR